MHLESLHDALLARFRRREEESSNAGPGVDSGPSPLQAQSGHVAMKGDVSAFESRHECKALPIVPVKVKGRGKDEVVTTYALLDNGSTSTWCIEGLAKRLGFVGARIQVSLSTIENDSNPTSCCRVSLEIMDLNEVNMVELPEELTKEKLNISTDGVSCQGDVERWPHLSGILVPERIRGEVELLIGQDVPEALEADEIRSRRGDGPYASRTKLGWTLNGPLRRHGRCEKHHVNFVRVDEELGHHFHPFMNLEFRESVSDPRIAMSRQDEKVLAIYESRRALLMVTMKLL